MATYEEIKKANDAINLTPIKGKDYAEVNQRIKAFRMVYPDGMIATEMVSNENGVCVFRAIVKTGENGSTLATGTAYEKEGSTFINKTSYIENCETSAIGRALGIAGFGIDTSVASAEEVLNAQANQNPEKITSAMIEVLKKKYTGENMTRLLEVNGLKKIEDMPLTKAVEIIRKLNKKGE